MCEKKELFVTYTIQGEPVTISESLSYFFRSMHYVPIQDETVLSIVDEINAAISGQHVSVEEFLTLIENFKNALYGS